MLESVLNINTDDNKKIFCILNKAKEKKSKNAVILAHGLTGHPNEYIHYVARDYFLEKGYDVYRIAFYYDGEEYRDLNECTLKIHADDLNTLVNSIKKDHQNLFACGHSYGGMSLLIANPHINALAFWDSSFMPWEEFWKNDAKPIPDGIDYMINWGGVNRMLPRAMYDEAKSIGNEDSIKLAKNIKSPSLVLMAEHGGHDNCQLLYDEIVADKSFSMIKNADHCFTIQETALELTKLTYKWFSKYA